MMGPLDATREATEVGLEVGDFGLAETPGSAVHERKAEPLSAELDGAAGLALDSPSWLEAEASEETALKEEEKPEDSDDLEAETSPAPTAEGSDVEKVDIPDASPVFQSPGRRLREATSDESQGEGPPKKQGKSGAEHADGDTGATRPLKLNVSNGSDPEAPPRKVPKTHEKIGVDRVARPLRQRTASAPS